MRKLFLTSSGQVRKNNDKYSDAFLDFLVRDPEGMKLAFIPTAAYPEVNKDFVDIIKDDLARYKFEIEDVYLEDENADSLYEKLKTFDIIYVNGGNTFYLLDQVRKSGFDKIIGKLLDEGKIYFGVSAGSYIACPTIEMANWKHQDKDIVGLKDLTALDLVPFLITAHYTEEIFEAVRVGAKATNLPIVALTDQQAVIVIGDKIQVVGEGERLFYNGFKEVG